MKIFLLCPRSFGANTYLLVSGKHAIAVDPCVTVGAISKALDEAEARLEGILLTHGHFDHTASVDKLRETFPVPLTVHAEDAVMLTDGRTNGYFDFFGREQTHRPAEKVVLDGDIITLGDEEIKVIHTPGHSRGSCCFLAKDEDGKDFLISGDTLFSDNIGRCDLYGGDEAEMARSLKRLSALDGSMTIYPGHGDSDTLGRALMSAAYFIDLN